MGYGLGVFLIALGLIFALAVTDSIEAIDLTMIGWILAAAGLLIIGLTALQMNSRRKSTSVTTHSDGSQTVQENRHDNPGV